MDMTVSQMVNLIWDNYWEEILDTDVATGVDVVINYYFQSYRLLNSLGFIFVAAKINSFRLFIIRNKELIVKWLENKIEEA